MIVRQLVQIHNQEVLYSNLVQDTDYPMVFAVFFRPSRKNPERALSYKVKVKLSLNRPWRPIGL
jgi:hypothetical protein